MTIVLVCGGRNYADREHLFKTLDNLTAKLGFTQLIHGAARGADTLAGEWAQSRGLPVKAYPADWNKWSRSAGPRRNQQMLEEGRPDFVVAFPGGRGTAHMTSISLEAGVHTIFVTESDSSISG